MIAERRRVNVALLALVAEGFLSRLSFGLIGFALPLYALHLGLSLPEIGLLVSLDVMVASGLKPVMGWAADRFGFKRSFMVAVAFRSLVPLLLILTDAPWQLYAIRAVHGLSQSLRDPSVNALLAEHGGKRAVASAFAWYSTAKSVAGSLSKAAAGILLALTASDFSLVFGLACLLSALPLYVVARHVREQGHGVAMEGTTGAAATAIVQQGLVPGPQRMWRLVLPFAGLGLMISSTANMLSGLFPVLATEYAGLTEAQTGVIYMISTFAIILAGPMFGWMSDNVSRKLVLLVRSTANILSSLVYLAVPSFPGIAAGKAVDDMGKAAFRPAWGALMAHVSAFDLRRRAQVISYMDLGDDIGSIAAPIFAGLLWGVYGLGAVLGVRILLAIATEVYAIILDGPEHHRRWEAERGEPGPG